MARLPKLDQQTVDVWLAANPAWERQGDLIARTFKFRDFSESLAFFVRVALLAERKDHHPDVELGWGRARIAWWTHDVGGLTKLDIEQAEATDQLAG